MGEASHRARDRRRSRPAFRTSAPVRADAAVDAPAEAPAEAADAPNRWRVTAEVLVSKIFPAGFGWQAASVVAATRGWRPTRWASR